VVRDLGVTGAFARAVGLSSSDASGAHVGTSWQTFDVGVRQRVHVASNVLLRLSFGYGNVAFLFDAAPSDVSVLPSVRYTFLRAGLDTRVSFGAFSVVGGGAYLDVASSAMSDVFPRASFGGVEANLGAAYAVARHVELAFGLGYTRMFATLSPEPGDAHVAGGALDEMYKASIGVAYLQ
jgi:hypothetical protein